MSATTPSVQFVEIHPDQAGQRIDNFLLARLKGVPKSYIYRICRKGEVRVNKKRIKPDYKLKPADVVRIPPVRVSDRPAAAKPGQGLVAHLKQAVLFESDGVMVINKPAGLAVHGGSGVQLGLIESLRAMYPEAPFLELVHRLDRDTSGCIMIAKKRSMLRHLQAALREKSLRVSQGGVSKVYQALVKGVWSRRVTTVEAPLLRQEDAAGERIVKVNREGKPALTQVRLLQDFGTCSLIEAKPITGRTHQIRVHAQYQGHSLVGDQKYGNDEFNAQMKPHGFKRLCLHASQLRFTLPSGEVVTVDAPLPDDLTAGLQSLQQSTTE